ncbi:MAG: nitroreductase family protein [bacterium]
MDVLEAIRKRRSIRRFGPEPVPREALETLVDAARLAPSGMNIQPLEFIVVDDPEVVAKVFPLLLWAGYIMPKGNPPPGEEPKAYIVNLINHKLKPRTPKHDVAAAAENIHLAAVSMGLGTCWVGAVNRPKLAEALGIPKDYEIDTVIAIGYPAESPVLEVAEGSIEYWKDGGGVLHVPKRPLKDILHVNGFGRRGVKNGGEG